MQPNKVFPSLYLAPIEYYFHLINSENAVIDIYENFVKQTYRNRCCILSPNGVQNLTVPLVNARKRKLIKNMKISYDDNWRKIHWKSLEAAYRSSPYFEYYEDEFHPFYHKNKYDLLIDFNGDLQHKIIELLNIDVKTQHTEHYIENVSTENDYRNVFSPKLEAKLNFTPYIQVFSDRNGFNSNMSILDLLFNEGPNTVNYIKNLNSNT